MKCPGQDIRYWKPGAIFDVKCPQCGHEVEFFKDDTTRKCGKCGYKFANPDIDFSCASYCQYAEQCLGSLPPELVAAKEDLLKDRVAVEMKRYFKKDFKRIGHAMRVARHAERIGKNEGGNLAVILTAAYLHDIGIHEAERKHGSAAPKYQEKEGPGIARSIMTGLGANVELIDEVCDIIGHHHRPRSDESVNFKALYDADLIANLEERQKENPMDTDKLTKFIEKSFLTKSGRKEANKPVVIQESESALSHWPVQIRLVPAKAPFLKGADLLVLADCVAVAFPTLHRDFLRGRVVMMGCPKFDDVQAYINKFAEVFNNAGIKSITIPIMEVPCCSGLPAIVKKGMDASGKKIPIEEVVIGARGQILRRGKV